MKKSNVLFMGLLILAAGIVMMSCASIEWDKDVPAEKSATLYYAKDYVVEKFNGQPQPKKSMGFMAVTYPGKGIGKRDKAAFIIPAGEHTLSIVPGKTAFGGKMNTVEVKHNFLPLHHYELDFVIDEENYAGNIGKAVLGAASGDTAGFMKFVVNDVTNTRAK